MKKLTALQAVAFSLFFAITAQAQTLATLDWTVAETLIALNTPPKAVGDVQSYKQWVNEPQLAANTLDLGIRMQPNPEQILSLAKNEKNVHFINTSFYTGAKPTLEKFAKVDSVDFYQEGSAWQNIEQATKQVAELIGKPHAYGTLMKNYWQKIDEISPLVKEFTARPIALVQFIDTRHLRIYGNNSPFGAVLNQLGFTNAWTADNNTWGFATIEVTRLMKLPTNSRLVVVKPYPSNIGSSLKYNVLWQKLAMAKDPLILPSVWTFGGIPSAQRFAEILANGLMNGGEKW